MKLTFFITFLMLSSEAVLAQNPPTITRAVGDTNATGLHWKSLDCPAGQAIIGMPVNEGGWTAGVQLLCNRRTITYTWPTSAPYVSEFLGGRHGNHDAQLACPQNSWLIGLKGQTVFVEYFGGQHERDFLANPILRCLSRDGTLSEVADPQFAQQPRGGSDGVSYGAVLITQCPSDMVAMGMDVAVEPEHHPDIKAIRLHCKTAQDL